MATMNISLPDGLRDWVDRQVATGRFANASDYVRDLIRSDQQRSEGISRLQAEIDKGRASGISDKSLDEIVAEVKRKNKAALKARDAA